MVSNRKVKKIIKKIIQMGWYKAHRTFATEPGPITDRCIFCGEIKPIKRTDFTIIFSEFETNTGSICKDCYSANARKVSLG